MTMLYHAEFRTDHFEIHIDKKEAEKWIITIYSIKHAVKELFEQHIVQSFHTAYMYIERNFLWRSRGKSR